MQNASLEQKLRDAQGACQRTKADNLTHGISDYSYLFIYY